jgi:hypothetical protein
MPCPYVSFWSRVAIMRAMGREVIEYRGHLTLQICGCKISFIKDSIRIIIISFMN